jgi:site-specific recombinase XerD
MSTENAQKFSEVYASYLLAQQARHLSRAYRALLSLTCTYWLERHDDLPLTDYTPDHIRQWLVYLSGEDADHRWTRGNGTGLASASVNVHFRNLKAFMLWCEQDGKLQFGSAPIRKVKTPKAREKLPDYLTQEELRDLLEGVLYDESNPNSFRDYCILFFFADTGVRLNELVNITLDDVNMHDGIVRVLGKGDRERGVRLGVSLRRQLAKYIHEYRREVVGEVALFTNDEGYRHEREGVRSVVVRALRKHVQRPLRKYGPHTLRHTFATLDLQFNHDIKATSLQLGHTTTDCTQRYLHITSSKRGGRSPLDVVMAR